MRKSWRAVGFWSTVTVAVAGASGSLWWAWDARKGYPAPAARVAVAQQAALAAAAAGAAPASAPASAPAAAAWRPAEACPATPVLAATNAGDGDYALSTAAVPGVSMREHMAASKGAQRDGRLRDAEVAGIAACRVAADSSAGPLVPLANAQLQLARVYFEAARGGSEAAVSASERARELLQRARRTYAAVLGSGSSRARLADRLLAQLGASPATLETPPGPIGRRPVPVPRTPGDPAASERALPAQAPVVVELRTLAPERPAGSPAGPQRGGSVQAPAAVLAGPELVQLESDLQRLREQAANVTDDPAGFQRRAREAEARRAACAESAECLRRWYSERRRELFGEF